MIYELNKQTNEIAEISDEQSVRRALLIAGWKKETIGEFFVSAKVLHDATHFFCRFKNRLEEIRLGREGYVCRS